MSLRKMEADLGMLTPSIASHAFAEANRWLTGHIPQDRDVILGIS